MRGLGRLIAALALTLIAPAAVFAQASISGTVKDASGAVLPGVTVEAASPALIEKVRSVASDGSGQYKIENLRPGTYEVTFTLAGFATVKREGIELTGHHEILLPLLHAAVACKLAGAKPRERKQAA